MLPERITDSASLSLQEHRQRRQNASIFFDKPVLQHIESDQFKFCASTTLQLCHKNIRKERFALQPLQLVIGTPYSTLPPAPKLLEIEKEIVREVALGG